MICDFCGSTIDDNEFECPYCGHKTGIEPQTVSYDENQPEEFAYQDNYDEQFNEQFSEEFDERFEEKSFKDNEYNDEPEAETEEEERPRIRKQKKEASSFSKFKPNFSGEKSIGQVPILIGIGTCAVISLICLISVISTKSAIEQLEQDMLSQFYQLQSANIELSSQVSALGGDISTVTTTINEQNDSKNITITRSPSSDATYLGRGSDDDVSQNSPIFYAEATGAITDIKWQVKENGEWVNINFDQNNQSDNTTYGLHIYNIIGSTAAQSQLCSRNVTAEAFNKQYRAVFYDSYGSKATEVATLSERAQ